MVAQSPEPGAHGKNARLLINALTQCNFHSHWKMLLLWKKYLHWLINCMFFSASLNQRCLVACHFMLNFLFLVHFWDSFLGSQMDFRVLSLFWTSTFRLLFSISLNYSNAPKTIRLCFIENFVATWSVHKIGTMKSKLRKFQSVYWKEQATCSCVEHQKKFIFSGIASCGFDMVQL